MTKATNDATLNQAGTIYQCFIALRDCFELQDDDVLEIETHGDVSVISSNEGSSFQKEVKHHFGKSSLGERSIDFWKTLANWYFEYDRIKRFSSCILLTTSKIDADSKFYNWNNISKEEKLNILKEIGRLVKDKEKSFREQYLRIFNSTYDETRLLEILEKFSIESGKNNLSAISKEFSNYTLHIPEENRNHYIGALLGEILVKVKDPPHKWIVTKKEFSKILQVQSAAYAKGTKNPLPNAFRGIRVPEEKIKSLDSKKFVNAIREIDYEKEIPNAISDYWKMEKTVMEYFKYDPIYCSDLENYKNDLSTRLDYAKDEKELELDENTNIKIINISKRLYLNVMQWKADDFGSIIQNQDFFQRGIIHEIVDTTKFKWKVGEKEDEH